MNRRQDFHVTADPYETADYNRAIYDPLGAAYDTIPPAPYDPPGDAPALRVRDR